MGNASVSISEVARPLLTPDECMRIKSPVKDRQGEKILEPGDMLIFVAGFNTVYGVQILFFLDPVFSKRVKIPPPGHVDADPIFKLRSITRDEPEEDTENHNFAV